MRPDTRLALHFFLQRGEAFGAVGGMISCKAGEAPRDVQRGDRGGETLDRRVSGCIGQRAPPCVATGENAYRSGYL
jgi:hypothetical protein